MDVRDDYERKWPSSLRAYPTWSGNQITALSWHLVFCCHFIAAGADSLSLSLSWFSQPCHGRAYTASPTIVMIVVLSLLSLFILSYFLSNFLFDCILVDESGFGGLRKKKIFVSGFGCLKGWSFGGGYVFEMGFCVRVWIWIWAFDNKLCSSMGMYEQTNKKEWAFMFKNAYV